MASESAIKSAFLAGDGDDDDGLSIPEAKTALEKLSGKSVDYSTVENACSSCNVGKSKEMTCKWEFSALVEAVGEEGVDTTIKDKL
ncbi:MAG: hypothetical protein M1839_003276 [Geoglossum umbratile]|nr:MAG: hypothetical protein M1839_003276 [Geoglossum umbratile]